MSISIVSALLLLLLGPGLVIVSLFASLLGVLIVCVFVGAATLCWLTHIFAGIPMAYVRDHRTVENNYHRQIVQALDSMLKEGRITDAKDLTSQYLEKTKNSSFMRNPLHDIVQSMKAGATEQTAVP